MLLPVVIGAAAALASLAPSIGLAAAGAGFLSNVIGTTISAAFVAGVIGSVVAAAASFAMQSIMRPKPAASAQERTNLGQDRKQTVRAAAMPRAVVYGRARVGGALVFVASAGPDLQDLHLVIALAGHPIDAVEVVFLGDKPFAADMFNPATGVINDPGHPYRNHLNVRWYLGNQVQADQILSGEAPGWTNDHLLLGCAYLAVRLTYSRDLFPNGLSDISAQIRGKSDILDPRTGTTGHTANWALCVLDYLRSPLGLACAADEIDTPSFVAAANLSDEDVPIDGSMLLTRRYSCNGSFRLDEAPISVMEGMLSAGAGTLTYVQGQYRLHGAAWTAPTARLGPGDFAGDIRLDTRPPRRELFNAVRGTFIDPARGWQQAEFVPVLSAADEAEDGERIFRDLPLPYTIEHGVCWRLAQIALRQHRDGLRFTAPLRYAALRLCVWQVVAVTHPDLGWSDKPFRLEAWRFEPSTGGIEGTFREENAANYAWLGSQAAAPAPSPNTTLVDPLAVPGVASVSVTGSSVLQPDGTALPLLDIAFAPSAHPFVTGHEVQWRLQGSGEAGWTGVELPMPTGRHQVRSVLAGAAYDARVRPVAGLVRGPWSATNTQSAPPDVTAPGIPSGLAATGLIRAVALGWTPPGDADLLKVEVFEALSQFGTYAKVGETAGNSFLRTGLFPGSSAWWRVRAVDRTGNAGALSAPVQGTAALLLTDDLANQVVRGQNLAPETLITLAAQMGTAVVGTAAIQNAAITSAKIGDAQVDSLQIAGEAATTYRNNGWFGYIVTPVDPTFDNGAATGPYVFAWDFWSPSLRPGVFVVRGFTEFDPGTPATDGGGEGGGGAPGTPPVIGRARWFVNDTLIEDLPEVRGRYSIAVPWQLNPGWNTVRCRVSGGVAQRDHSVTILVRAR